MVRKDLVYVALIALLAAAVYANSLKGDFIYDDYVYVLNNPQVAGDDSIFGAPTPSDHPEMGLYRPLVILSYRLNRVGSGFLPAAFHGTNIVLHLMAAAGLYFLVRSISANREAAFLSGLLFAVHPVHAEAVAWIVGRAEVMAALFCILAALAHRAALRNRWFYVPAGIAFLAACLSKENAFAFPLLLAAMDVLCPGQAAASTGGAKDSGGARRRFAVARVLRRLRPEGYGAYLAVLAAVASIRIGVLGAFGPSAEFAPYGDLTFIQRIPVALSILAEAVRLLIAPVGLRIFYHASELREPSALQIALLVLAAALVAVLAIKKSPAVFWVLWVPLALVTVLNVVPIGAPFAERFLYLPSAGACAAAGLALAHLCGWASPDRGFRSAIWAPVFIVLVLAGMTWARNPVYRDAVALWEDAVRKADFPYTHYNLGESYYHAGYIDYLSPKRPGALAELRRSLEMDPDHPYAYAAHFTLARYYLEGPRKDYRRAAQHLRATIKGPERIETLPRMAEAYATLAEIALATEGAVVPVDEALEYTRLLLEHEFRPREVAALQERLEALRP